MYKKWSDKLKKSHIHTIYKWWDNPNTKEDEKESTSIQKMKSILESYSLDLLFNNFNSLLKVFPPSLMEKLLCEIYKWSSPSIQKDMVEVIPVLYIGSIGNKGLKPKGFCNPKYAEYIQNLSEYTSEDKRKEAESKIGGEYTEKHLMFTMFKENSFFCLENMNKLLPMLTTMNDVEISSAFKIQLDKIKKEWIKYNVFQYLEDNYDDSLNEISEFWQKMSSSKEDVIKTEVLIFNQTIYSYFLREFKSCTDSHDISTNIKRMLEIISSINSAFLAPMVEIQFNKLDESHKDNIRLNYNKTIYKMNSLLKQQGSNPIINFEEEENTNENSIELKSLVPVKELKFNIKSVELLSKINQLKLNNNEEVQNVTELRSAIAKIENSIQGVIGFSNVRAQFYENNTVLEIIIKNDNYYEENDWVRLLGILFMKIAKNETDEITSTFVSATMESYIMTKENKERNDKLDKEMPNVKRLKF